MKFLYDVISLSTFTVVFLLLVLSDTFRIIFQFFSDLMAKVSSFLHNLCMFCLLIRYEKNR